MRLTRKEMFAAAASGALGAAVVLAATLDSWRWAMALLVALLLCLAAIVLLALRRQDVTRAADVERIERKIDNLALRVVTESQATHRELGGLIEELGSTLHERGPGSAG